jgi:hypothetical protein
LRSAALPDLTLRVIGEYFHQIRRGEKVEEFRLCSPYWRKRIEGRHYRNVILTWGYPQADDCERRLVRRWKGYEVRTIHHPHFGPGAVEVFAINVSGLVTEVLGAPGGATQ